MLNVGVDKIKESFMFQFEVLNSAIDRLSREQGKIIKVTRIVDFAGVVMGNADKGGWQKWEKENVLPLFVGASIEITQSVFVTNLPGWMRGIYNVISRGLPQHITKRLRVPGDTAACLKNAEFLEHVGASLF